MQVQIRLAESGHSYHYSELTTVHSLMHQIRKDFKVELQDQKIIMKSGQVLKSTMSFDSIQELMKKTLATNFHSQPSNSKQFKQIQCLYIYNQKELLKPIQVKIFNQEFYLKLLKEKSKQMTLLAQNSYESKSFADKVLEKNVNIAVQSINKRLKTPFEDITLRYGRFLQSLNQRNYTKMQISALLDLIQNQDKARKLLIRNIEYLFDRRTKKRYLSITQKIAKQVQKENQLVLKQSSSFFSNSKSNQFSQGLTQLTKKFKQVDQKYNRFYDKLKQSKKQVIKQKFIEQERLTFRIDKKTTQIEKQYQQKIKLIKQLFNQFCQQMLRVNTLVVKSKQKQVKDLFRNLITIHEKIYNFQKKVQQNIKQFTLMFLQLSRIHMKGQTQNIKIVFEVYVQLIKSYDELDGQVKKMEKEITIYKQDKIAHGAMQVSQFNDGKNLNMPFKKQVKSPRKQQKKQQKQQASSLSSITKQLQINIPKINSPIKNKITRQNTKQLFNQQITSRTFELALKQNKQLLRRLNFNKRLEGLVRYCSQLCEKENEMRKVFKSSKEIEQNKIDLLGIVNVPSVEIDYSQSTDMQLVNFYKKWVKQSSHHPNHIPIPTIQPTLDWQHQLIQYLNSTTRTLNSYLSSKSNITQRQRNLQKILSILSQTFYKMMNRKLNLQIQSSTKMIKQQLQAESKQMMEKIVRENQQLKKKINELQSVQYNNNGVDNNDYYLQLTSTPTSTTQQQSQSQQQQQQSALISSTPSQLNNTIKHLLQQNQLLKQNIRDLSEKLLSYREQVNQTTQKLIQSYQETNAEQVAKLTEQVNRLDDELKRVNEENEKLMSQLNVQKQTITNLSKQAKQSRVQIQKAGKNLLRQVQTCQTLYKQIQHLQSEKLFYQQQFSQLKSMLANKQVAIIKLQKQLQQVAMIRINNNNNVLNQMKQQNEQQQEISHQCEYQQQVSILRQDKETLQQELEELDKELKEILFKQTKDQEVQTEQENSNLQQELLLNQQYQLETKQQFMINNFIQSNQNNSNNQPHHSEIQPHVAVVSKYYISSSSSMTHNHNQQWTSSTYPAFTHISIGKTIQEGMSHIFLPFAGDIYIGVTACLEDMKHVGNYQQYLTEMETYHKQGPPIYILDIKDYNSKTTELIKQCSLVLVIKVDKKSQITMGNKVMVSGKIQYALGFEDDDMTIKNYSHFLQE